MISYKEEFFLHNPDHIYKEHATYYMSHNFEIVDLQSASERGNCSAYQLAATSGYLGCPRDTAELWWFHWPDYGTWHYAGNGLLVTCDYEQLDNETFGTTPMPVSGGSPEPEGSREPKGLS